jgi:hypothetical protein
MGMPIEGRYLKTIKFQPNETELVRIDKFMRNPKLAFSKSFDLNTRNSIKFNIKPIGTITTAE